MNAPCKNCDRRSVTCHDNCKSYKAFEAERKSIYEARVKEKREAVHRNIKRRST